LSLARGADRVVSKAGLVETNWPGRAISDESLARCVSDIRAVLGPQLRKTVRTVSGHGYMRHLLIQPSVRDQDVLVLAEELGDKATRGDVDGVGLAIVHGDDPGVDKGHLTMQGLRDDATVIIDTV